jgi:GT2 family glycosyltransferase/glycosyltransferase involved in cell wall biosynthesis
MPARKTTTGTGSDRAGAAVLFVHATGTATPEAVWLEGICGLDATVCSHANLPGVNRTKHNLERLGELISELAGRYPGRPIVFLRAGIDLRAPDLESLVSRLLAPHSPPALTVLTNGAPECNPFALLESPKEPEFDQMRGAVCLMGRNVVHPWPWWPEHLLALSSVACERLTRGAPRNDELVTRLGRMLGLLEPLFIPDLRAGKFLGIRNEPNESARPTPWGGLTRNLQRWLENGAPDLSPNGAAAQPVTLHITHSWGGGVSLWTEAFIEADTTGAHLQLRSETVQSGQGNGQRLALYSGNTLTTPIATWWLQPPIQSVEVENEQYREALERICARFGVGRILVSSLVGHTLDALATGLPTIQVLHDHFPLWPLLSVHPSVFMVQGRLDLDAALQSQAGQLEFTDHDVAAWTEIREAYLARLEQHDVRLVAPSRSVIEISRELDQRMAALEIALIPHGTPGGDRRETVRARPRADGKLRVLIPGRIQPGKGKALLQAALPDLTRFAHVYLVGSGKHGEDFFGLPGVSVLFQYDRNELDTILAAIGPHAAALLSVVPETFSYTLSELKQRGVPVIATRRGAFAERLDHGRTGWLIEPLADELVAAIEHFWNDPAALQALGDALRKDPAPRMADMIQAYDALCPPRSKESAPPFHGLDLDSAQWVSVSGEFTASQAEVGRALSARREAERELAERTRWAERADQAFKRIEQRNAELQVELEEREQWARQANTEAEAARRLARDLEQKVQERTAWAKSLDRTMEAERLKFREVTGELESERQLAHERLQEAQRQQTQIQVQLAQTQVQLAQNQVQLAQARNKLHQSRNDLQALLFTQQQSEAERQRLQDLQDLIVSSLSWRLTRPLRVANRAVQNAWQARIYNPARWPLLLSKLARDLVTLGPGGALRRLQAPAQSDRGMPPAAMSRPDRKPPGDDLAGSRPTQPGPEQRAPVKSGLAAPEPAAAADPEAEISDQPIAFEPVETPVASIVIPAFNQWRYTRQCLASLAETASLTPFEIILVDDASTDETAKGMNAITGITRLRNESNSGFIASCNRGLEQARGEFTVFLNNDTEVTDGWLDRLLETFEQEADAGLVGARLVYPDGRLQECGGMIFNDGSGWNYGKHDDPEKPEYQYLREVDYCSGACIALRTGTLRDLGGFDAHYAPAYYEDTDLAFRIRERGKKVIVQPASTVIHHEGITSGTDTSSGTKRYQAVNREKFLQRWRQQLQNQPDPITDPKDLAQVRNARDHRHKGRVLIIDATTPEPDQDSGSVRLTNIMRCFRELGYAVTFFADNRMHAGRYTWALQQAGVEVQYLPWLDPLKAFFEARGVEFDYVFISRHYIAVNYLSLLKQHCLEAPFIFDTVDLHYLREQRLAELENSATLRQVAKQTRRSELSVIAAADATVVVSPTEVDVLAKDAPGAPVHVLSNIHDVPGRRAGFSSRKDLFFVGGYQHPPNIDAACWFVDEIWPRVRKQLPEARFHLIGSKATDKVKNLAGNGVEFHGFVEDLEPWLDGCRLAVAPLRYGAGVKGKVNMSMSYGQPVVATAVAVEGMHAENGREVLVADTAAAFADEIVRLYSDESLWLALSDAAIKNVETHFSLDAARRSLRDLLTSLDATN